MVIRFYNTLTRKKEAFKPIKPKEVRMYTCGPTVYHFAHIGNLRAFIVYDLIRRYLKYKGFRVRHVMNITDVDDKTIRDSKKEGLSLKKFTEKYTKIFFEDLRTLNIEEFEEYPKATEHIPEMVNLIKKLLKKGFAYKGEDGSIYYDISKFRDYGKLSKTRLSELRSGARVCQDEYTKEQAHDFALWKAWTPEDGDVFWETELGKGRPGWHIECSVMSMKYLGSTFDIHGGGVDLIFPHHENEIAQSEAATGRPFVNYWLHNAHILVDGKKMSKSLGNFFTLKDLFAKGHDPRAIRYALLSTHYRSQLNITDKVLYAAKQAVDRILNFRDLLKEIDSKKNNKKVNELIREYRKDFDKYMDDDLDIGQALGSLFDFMKEINKLVDRRRIGKRNAEDVLKVMKRFDMILGIMGEETLPPELIGKVFSFASSLRKDLARKDIDTAKKLDGLMKKVDTMEPNRELLGEIVEAIADVREELRKKKEYGMSDYIRAELNGMGIVLEDKQAGSRWRLG